MLHDQGNLIQVTLGATSLQLLPHAKTLGPYLLLYTYSRESTAAALDDASLLLIRLRALSARKVIAKVSSQFHFVENEIGSQGQLAVSPYNHIVHFIFGNYILELAI